jgi:ATP-binding cassette subfamily C protein
MGNNSGVVTISDFMRPVWRVFWLIGVFSLILNFLVLIVPMYMLQVYDRVLVSRSFDTLVMITILAVIGIAVFGILEGVRGVMANRAAAAFEVSISPAVFERSVRYEVQDSGSSEALRDIGHVRSFIANRTAMALLDLPFTPLFLLMLYLIHPWLGHLTLFGCLVLVLLAGLNDFATFSAQRSASQDAQAAMATAQSILRNAEPIRAMGMLGAGLARWNLNQQAALNGQDVVGVRNSSFLAVTKFVRTILQIAILGLGAYLVLANEMTAGMIFASSMISARALGPIEQSVGGWRSFAQARLSYQKLSKLLASTRDAPERTELPKPNGQILVENLVYTGVAQGMTQPEPILKGLNFSIEAGEVLVVLGASGAGKSTLARLLVGAMAPARGAVRLDGAEISVWPDAARFAYIGYLPQSVELMPGTIAENIARLDPMATDESIIDAAERAGVHEMVTRFQNAYETRVGLGGRALSGGQTQRIALARALYGRPALMVLDEPNSHLDGEGERVLLQAIGAAKALGTTCVIISQRTSIVQAADKIMILSNGAVEAHGPRDEMLARLAPGMPTIQNNGGGIQRAPGQPAAAPSAPRPEPGTGNPAPRFGNTGTGVSGIVSGRMVPVQGTQA